MVELIASLLIDLSEQKLYAYNPQHQVVRTMPVSSGRSSSPTPIGASRVLSKVTHKAALSAACAMCVMVVSELCAKSIPPTSINRTWRR
jgi:hypothetical protein